MRRSVILTLSAALLIAPVLTGCSAIESGVKSGVEQAITDASGGKLDVGLEQGLPADFPKDEVPVIDGQTTGIGSTVNGTKTWIVTVQAPNTGTAAKDALVAAGFTVDAEASAGEGSLVTLSSPVYDIKLVVTAETVIYTVTPR